MINDYYRYDGHHTTVVPVYNFIVKMIYDRKQNIMSNMIWFNRFMLCFDCPNSRLVRWPFRANTVTPATLVSGRIILRRTWYLILPATYYYTIYLSF